MWPFHVHRTISVQHFYLNKRIITSLLVEILFEEKERTSVSILLTDTAILH